MQGLLTKRLVRNDAELASNTAAFDHQVLAAALTKTSGSVVDAGKLPIKHVAISLAPLQVRFQTVRKAGEHWLFEPENKGLSGKLQARWSPDSSRLFTVIFDTRKVAARDTPTMYGDD